LIITALAAHNNDVYYATPTQVCVVVDGVGVVLAGTDEAGFADGKEARFDNIHSMEPWSKGGVVVAEFMEGRVRLVGRDGIATTLATGLPWLSNFCVRPDGGVIVGDRYVLWKITPDGVKTTLIHPFKLGFINGIAACPDNSVLVADVYSAATKRMVLIAPTGTITTIETHASPKPIYCPGMMDTAGMVVGWVTSRSLQRMDLATNTATELVLTPGFLGLAMALDWFGNLIYAATDGSKQQIVRVDVGMQPGVGAGKQPAWTPKTHRLFGARARASAEAVLAFSGSHVLGALWLHVLGQVPAGGLGPSLK
jgi:hypothetical protein